MLANEPARAFFYRRDSYRNQLNLLLGVTLTTWDAGRLRPHPVFFWSIPFVTKLPMQDWSSRKCPDPSARSRESSQRPQSPSASSVCHSTMQATATPKPGICFGACQFVLGDGLSPHSLAVPVMLRAQALRRRRITWADWREACSITCA